MVVVASPDYLALHGVPSTPSDLARHRGIGWTFPRINGAWPFRARDRIAKTVPPASVRASDGEASRLLALGGAGLARLALFHVGPDIEAGRLVPVLEGFNPGDREDIHAVYVGQGGPLPARVHAFIDFLAEHIRIGCAPQIRDCGVSERAVRSRANRRIARRPGLRADSTA